ncbi:hypothetical protein BC938DRAFT_472576 [Jimgerdemannia flammicorona]|uniref:Uncharacterized protein n=1 Tax=Jimgerdemannia flammicorona TaxID=994334 RepID=A0A433QZV1_9FUNG|nr:hypothetical protein BC938DRAFT_472576 [Jimgerdemannia flammicorona]
MSNKLTYTLSFLMAFVCTLGLAFVSYPLPSYVCHIFPPTVENYVYRTQAPINITIQVFLSLADLAKHFPNFSPLVIDLYEIHTVLQDANIYIKHSNLPTSCRNDVNLLFVFLLATDIVFGKCRYKYLQELTSSIHDICQDNPDPLRQSALSRVWGWMAEYKDKWLGNMDDQLLQHFVDEQDVHSECLGHMQTAVAHFLDLLQTIQDNARNGLITIVNGDEHVVAIEYVLWHFSAMPLNQLIDLKEKLMQYEAVVFGVDHPVEYTIIWEPRGDASVLETVQWIAQLLGDIGADDEHAVAPRIHSGLDAADIWWHMLRQIHSVSDAIATAIVQTYPTVRSLWEVYNTLSNPQELLACIHITLEHMIDRAVSIRVYLIFGHTEPDFKINSPLATMLASI